MTSRRACIGTCVGDTGCTARIEISYFTSGIRWEADYLAIADPDERQLRLDSFVRVRNDSGEDYEDAQVRLVVGTLNLVEKIAVLARLPVGRIDELKRDEYCESAPEGSATVIGSAGGTGG